MQLIFLLVFVSRDINQIVNVFKIADFLDNFMFRQQEQIKQGWSLLSTLHCVLLHDKVKDYFILSLGVHLVSV